MKATVRGCFCLLAVAASIGARAKPIAFQDGWTVMAEYGTNTMRQAQVFYAPRFWWSGGPTYTKLIAGDKSFEHEIPGIQANYLVKRWNLASAQANVFTWGGAGQALVSESNDHELAWNAGAQVDYETRRLYSSLKTDLHRASGFSHRIDTLQLGIAPYEHDFDTLATWFVVQGRHYTGGIHEGTEWALLLRVFKRGAWVEAGATADGKLQAMAMVNF